ncbi:MAG: argininosuccinate lyase, partial [Candidatus Omnitrophica bacterium]|nr:argininosuccinate lyase [Candidatus Omnitrophota bacterium]
MAKKLWGGRFSKKIDPNFEKFSQSIGFDHKLAYYDLWGSIFHLEVLHKCGLNILSDQEYTSLKRELYAILRNTNKNKPNKFKYNKKSEDIHTEIQNRLEKKWGKVALKLHTFRSRNDQVVFDVKMYCKWESVYIRKVLLARLCFEIRRASEKYTKVWIPGYTHMQHAQPILLKNYLMAYHKMLSRDSKRLESADKNIDLYLGSGALSGVPISESYNKLTQLTKKFSKELKCNISINSPANTIDNVSDRDFVIEILNTLAILQMHLSRLAEDFILWSTSEFGFIELGDEFCTGSSLMPQKKNPDSLELIRGNTGRIYGNLVSVLTMMKG